MPLTSGRFLLIARAIKSTAENRELRRSAFEFSKQLFVCSFAFMILSGCQAINNTLFGKAERTDSELPAVEAPVANPVAYDARIEGDLPQTLRDLIERSSMLMTQKDRPPASYAALSKRVDDDLGRIKDVLASEAYYEAEVEATIDTESEPAQIAVSVDPGPLFHLQAVDIRYQPAEPVTAVPRVADEVGLSIGQTATGASLVAAEGRLVRQLNENGYPNARIASSQYLANRDTKTITATWVVDTGPLARFGELRVDGLKDVDADYVHRIADWKPGSLYDIREIERVRATLSGTRLFAMISPPPREDVPVEDGDGARNLRGQRGAAPVGGRRRLLFHR